ncbi:alpha/beta fold hydrolase [Vacuolonema iberomarrocanum]|uniref:alpha/beta fold hydrolase n=1 Tax=Vacuolonema iberomarrocanum TaxID=3454632 RepID=UPI001A0C476C|nr:alpha/beta fold hydrolase [filamentous cyanobacterium LEGE 07170]
MIQTTSLHIEKSGNPSAPAIVFSHALGTSDWMWHQQVELLNDDFYCITPDLPSHGKSNRIPWQSFSETARLIAQLIQEHTPPVKAHVVGLSLGAYTGDHSNHGCLCAGVSTSRQVAVRAHAHLRSKIKFGQLESSQNEARCFRYHVRFNAKLETQGFAIAEFRASNQSAAMGDRTKAQYPASM